MVEIIKYKEELNMVSIDNVNETDVVIKRNNDLYKGHIYFYNDKQRHEGIINFGKSILAGKEVSYREADDLGLFPVIISTTTHREGGGYYTIYFSDWSLNKALYLKKMVIKKNVAEVLDEDCYFQWRKLFNCYVIILGICGDLSSNDLDSLAEHPNLELLSDTYQAIIAELNVSPESAVQKAKLLAKTPNILIGIRHIP